MSSKTERFAVATKTAWKQPGPGYVDCDGKRINISSLEYPEQVLAHRYIRSTDTVLELGARYGTVSCVINKVLRDRSRHVVVEPDARVWGALERNRVAHRCKFGVVEGFMSNKRLGLANTDKYFNGYASTAVVDSASSISSFSLAEVKKQFGISRFSVLVADCEGFLEQFFAENPTLYDELRLVIFERDYPEKCDYARVEAALAARGFAEQAWADIVCEKRANGKSYFFSAVDRFQNVWLRPACRAN